MLITNPGRAAAVAFLTVVAGLLPGLWSLAHAQPASPAGLWRTVDDETGAIKSLVRVELVDGVVTARVEKILTPGRENATCTACEGDLKDQPVTGMTIIRDMRAGADRFEGGTILDPENGKSYKSHLWLEPDGVRLNVRGYIGVPMLGRSQVWLRAE